MCRYSKRIFKFIFFVQQVPKCDYVFIFRGLPQFIHFQDDYDAEEWLYIWSQVGSQNVLLLLLLLFLLLLLLLLLLLFLLNEKDAKLRKMLSFELGKEISQRCFFVLSRAWDKENVEFPRGIEPQTFWFRAQMLYH